MKTASGTIKDLLNLDRQDHVVSIKRICPVTGFWTTKEYIVRREGTAVRLLCNEFSEDPNDKLIWTVEVDIMRSEYNFSKRILTNRAKKKIEWHMTQEGYVLVD